MLLSLQKDLDKLSSDGCSIQQRIMDTLHPIVCLRNFWEVMEKSSYISPNEGWQCVFSDAIDHAELSKMKFGVKSLKQLIMPHFNSLIQKEREKISMEYPNVLAFSAVTLETFLDKHVNAYSDYYAGVFTQYQKAFNM